MTDTAATAPIRLVLADDHPIFRDGLARTLADAGDIDVVGQANDGEEAVKLAVELAPDLVLLDLSMPKGGGLGALEQIRALPAPPHVAILTASEEQDDLVEAMRLGALGYVLKGVGAGELVALVRSLARGLPHVTPVLAGRLLVSMRGRSEAAKHDPMADLSRREEETVKHYMTSILQKLQVRNRVEAAMLARQHLKG
jgi:DNA-binding NarL/FixJ family response regulator